MLVLRKNQFEVSDMQKQKLIQCLNLDTEPNGHLSGLDRLYREELIIKKPWIGYSSNKEINFKVCQTKTGLFKSRISPIEIKAKQVEFLGKNLIEISYGVSWIGLLLLYVTISLFGYVLINDSWDWLISCAIIGAHFISLFVEVNRSENKFNEYISSTFSKAYVTVKS